MKKVAIICLLFFGVATFGQNTTEDPLTDFLGVLSENTELAKQDVNTILEGYFTPALKAVGFGFSNGWYNTAKAHEALGFDLTVPITFVRVPQLDMSYYIPSLQQLDLVSPSDRIAPTVFGSSDQNDIPVFEDKDTGVQFSGLPGTGLQDVLTAAIVPVPLPQIGLGLINGTQLNFRVLPGLNIKSINTKATILGFGIMHDFKQYIPGVKKAPFDLSAFLGYTRAGIKRDVVGDGSKVSSMNISSLTLQAVVSKKLSIFTPYAGLGYSQNFMGFKMTGSYDVDGIDATPPIEDPIDFSANSGGLKGVVGFQLKLAVITLHADYTLQEYRSFTAGLGISIR